MYHIHGPALLDLNTQRDLLAPDGSYRLHEAERLVEPVRRVFSWATKLRVPVVSTRLREQVVQAPHGATHFVGDPATPGFQKMSYTLLRRRQEFPRDCGTSLPVEGFRLTQQFIFDLPALNLFECPRLDRLLSESEADVWLIVGGPLEWTLRTAVLGLLQRRQKVAVVSDAIGQWDPYEGDMALRQIESKNIAWLTAAEVLEKYGRPQPIRRPVVPIPALLAAPLPTAAAAKRVTGPTAAPAPTKHPARAKASGTMKSKQREFRMS
jgi:nicotinamidase-related amidase